MEQIVNQVVAKYGPMVVVLLVLVVADWGAGVSAALRQKKFEWTKLADIYLSTVLPLVGGWIVVAFVTEALTALTTLPEIVDQVTQAIGGYGFYGVAVAAILASIVKSLGEIAAAAPQIKPPAK